MSALDLPRAAWMTEDLVLLEDQARRFIAAEFAPHLERWHEAGVYDRMQERGDSRKSLSRLLHRAASRGRARYHHRFDGQVLAERSHRQNHRPVPANVRGLWLYG